MIIQTDQLYDSHCHLNDSSFDKDRDQVVQQAVLELRDKRRIIKQDESEGFVRDNLSKSVQDKEPVIIDVSVDLESARRAVANAQKFDAVVATAGIDPEIFIPGSELFKEDAEQLMSQLHEDLINFVHKNLEHLAAVGETGMDDYWLQRKLKSGDISNHERQKSLRLQEENFRFNLDLAVELDLPVTVHSRAAEQRCLDIVSHTAARGIFHSYTGDYQTAAQLLDKGWGIGVNGIATFKSASDLRKVLKKILGQVSSDWSPTDFYQKGVYFETDAPYLAPQGKRGERNQPQNVALIYDQLVQMLSSN